jgi:hemoglobin
MSQALETTSLYERLGGKEGVAAIANDIVERHWVNPIIKARFLKHDIDSLKRLSEEFLSMGSGGPAEYSGRDMRTAHTGLNLNERELVAVIDDALAVLDARGVDAVTRNEVLAILYSFKDEILHQ